MTISFIISTPLTLFYQNQQWFRQRIRKVTCHWTIEGHWQNCSIFSRRHALHGYMKLSYYEFYRTTLKEDYQPPNVQLGSRHKANSKTTFNLNSFRRKFRQIILGTSPITPPSTSEFSVTSKLCKKLKIVNGS